MIYAIQSGAAGPIKIGVTNGDVVARMKDLQTGSPYPLKILAQVETLCDGFSYLEFERLLHAVLADYRLHGEWFEPSHWVKAIVHLMQCPNGGIYISNMVADQIDGFEDLPLSDVRIHAMKDWAYDNSRRARG